MVYTSHNMRDVEEVCDRVLFMHKGRIIAEGTPQQVKDNSTRSHWKTSLSAWRAAAMCWQPAARRRR